MDKELSERIALFRFGVIAPLVGRALSRGEQEQILDSIVEAEWTIPGTSRTHIGRSTVLKWLRRYRDSGKRLEALAPKARADRGSARAIDSETEAALVELKRSHPDVSLAVLLRMAREQGIIGKRLPASRQTLYRLFARHGIERAARTPVDRRRFEAELPNDLWQCDCMHGPKVTVEDKLAKAYLIAVIDDHSRLITHAQFYLRENIQALRDCLIRAMAKRGLPRRLYVDNGAAFRTHRLRYGCAELGVALLHSEPGVPEGRGKIERWFRTVRSQFIPTLPDGLSLEALNTRLSEWIDGDYHARIHSTTGATPLQRYLDALHAVRPAPSDIWDYFRVPVRRKVDKDRSVSLDGMLFEAPAGLIGETVTLLYHDHDPMRVELFLGERSYGFLTPLDVGVNARVRRGARQTPEQVPADEPADSEPCRRHSGSVFTDPPSSDTGEEAQQ